MEFYQLEAFAMVVDCRSFSKAAEMLFLSQPTVSAHVKSLENKIGMPLLDRGKSDVTLTPAGETLYKYARDLLAMRSRALQDIVQSASMDTEQITIAASSVPCQYLLPQAAAQLEREHPGLTFVLKLENSRQVCEDVYNYRFALGVVGEPHALPRLKYIPLASDELVVAIPNRPEYSHLTEKDKLLPHDLENTRLLIREAGSGTRALFEAKMAEHGYSLDNLNISVFDNQETIKQSLRQGFGITVISRYVVEDYEEFGLLKLRSLDGISLERTFFLVYHEKRVLSPATERIKTFLVNYFSALKGDRP